MGQYYKPTNIDKREYIEPLDFDNGMKLMEHSYIGNSVTEAIESLIIPGGAWYKASLVWAGDYADGEPKTITKKNPNGHNLYSSINSESGKGVKLSPPFFKVNSKFDFLTNHDIKQVVALSLIEEDSDGWKIHPLPLLIAEGNGRGGGDFHGKDSRIGSWARNHISLEDHIEEGYKLIDGQFKEER